MDKFLITWGWLILVVIFVILVAWNIGVFEEKVSEKTIQDLSCDELKQGYAECPYVGKYPCQRKHLFEFIERCGGTNG